MENLAEGQGGKGTAESSAHAHKKIESETKVANFLARGEEILSTFRESIRAFEGQTVQMKTLATTVNELKEQVQGKRSRSDADTAASSSSKKVRHESDDDERSEETEPEVDEIEEIMNPGDTDGSDSVFLQDLSNFFEEETATGEAISDKVASLVNKSLRGKPDEEKMKLLKDSYKRPSNVENMQVPKVDRVIWEQLGWQKKAADSVRQKSIRRTMDGLVPVVLAMDHIANSKQPDMSLIKTYIGDTFKIMCHHVNQTNAERQDAIKKEVSHRYKSVCENQASATALFGDNLTEELKKLDAKPLKITTKPTFLGKGGSTGPNYYATTSNQRRPMYNQRSQNFQRSPANTQQAHKNFPRAFRNAPSFRGGKHSEKSGPIKRKMDQ